MFKSNIADSKWEAHKEIYFLLKEKLPENEKRRFEKRRNWSIHKTLDSYYNRLNANIKNYMVKTDSYIKLLNKQLEYEKTQNYKNWANQCNEGKLKYDPTFFAESYVEEWNVEPFLSKKFKIQASSELKRNKNIKKKILLNS